MTLVKIIELAVAANVTEDRGHWNAQPSKWIFTDEQLQKFVELILADQDNELF